MNVQPIIAFPRAVEKVLLSQWDGFQQSRAERADCSWEPVQPRPPPQCHRREKLFSQPCLVAVRSSSTVPARAGAQGHPQSRRLAQSQSSGQCDPIQHNHFPSNTRGNVSRGIDRLFFPNRCCYLLHKHTHFKATCKPLQ